MTNKATILNKHVVTASPVRSEIMVITPEIAKLYLEKNPTNRKINPREVEKLANAIKKGEWELNGEAIIINEHGELADGQHRLTAVIKADTPITALVVKGVSKRSFHTIDVGKPRTLPDILRIRGEVSTFTLTASLRLLYSYERARLLDIEMNTANNKPINTPKINSIISHSL